MSADRPRIAGLTRVRNVAHYISDILDRNAELCSAGIYVYDDCSRDGTAAVCRNHPAVVEVIEGSQRNHDRPQSETTERQIILERAQLDSPDWFLLFDADEVFELNPNEVPWDDCDGVRMKLFDFYITADDVDEHFLSRRWLGPEFREILMFFRNMPGTGYSAVPIQRESSLPPGARVLHAGYVRHYGKALSVAEWEDKCAYYSTHFPEPYRSKWLNRMGRAVHTESDFGRPLIEWKDRESLGVPLED